MSPVQLSVLRQALQPSPAPVAAADPISGPNPNSPGSNDNGSAAGANLDQQPNVNSGTPAGGSNDQPADVQLQPISSAIFDTPTSSPNTGNQASSSGNGGFVKGVSGGAGTGNVDSAANPQDSSHEAVNVVPQVDNGPQMDNAPQNNNLPQNNQAGTAGQGAAVGVNNQPALSRASNGALVVGSSTIIPGQAATINNHQISVGSDNIAIDGNTYAFAAPKSSTPVPLTIGGLPIQAAQNGGAIIAGSTFASGAQIVTAGHTISVASGNVVVVDGTSRLLPTAEPAAASPLMIGGSPMERAPNGAFIVGGSTLVVGAQTTISGHVISVGAVNVVIDGTTNALPTPAPTLASSPIVIDGQQMQRAPSGGVAIGSTTLALGAQTTIAGHVISVGPSDVVVDSSTYAFPSSASAMILSELPPGAQRSAITLPNGSVLSAGGVATISGQVVSVLSNDEGAVIGGSTIAFAPNTVFTVGGQTFTAAPTGFVVAGTSVSLDGPAVTISGTVVSLGPSGVQIGSSTLPLTSTSATGLAGFIVSAFDAPAAGTAAALPSVTGVTPFTGTSSKVEGDLRLLSIGLVVSLGMGASALFP
ncbi:hypothetical protein P7C71_g5085, partial [Lecanoromycetidae sp. Uapishka_2]